MSGVMSILTNQIQNMISYVSIANSYFQKRNPLMAVITGFLRTIYMFLTSGKRIKVLKYQVRLMHYRMYQMDQLIKENNPNNGGNNFLKYR